MNLEIRNSKTYAAKRPEAEQAVLLEKILIALPESGTEHFDFAIKQHALFSVSRIALKP